MAALYRASDVSYLQRPFIPRQLAIAAAFCFAASAQDARIVAFLQKHCTSCHNDTSKAADLSLVAPGTNVALWDKVHDRVTTGRMPPLGMPRPSTEELTGLLKWIEALPGRAAAEKGPGRVVSRRLNRAEYNNTVRDLLGVTIRPADEFPLDDAGYGFDTVGDVLSVSPMLMEKYITAARRLSKLAVYGESAAAKPTKLARFMTKKSQDDPTPGALPFSNRGAIYGSFEFPVAGEYELRMRVGNYRPRVNGTPRQRELARKRGLTPAEKAELAEENRKAYPPVKMVVTLDGKQVLTEIVEGNIDFQYAHGESIARVKVTAGEHFFRASFPEFAALDNPLDNMNLDGRRKLFIDYVDVVGPYNPEPRRPSKIFVCNEKTDSCLKQILSVLARRAYRRPVAADELGRLTALAASVRKEGDSFEESVRVALQAILLSPSFLFRAEPLAKTDTPVSEHDLATRLSYFLWSSMPDEELSALADRGELRKPGVMAKQLKRMLADKKSDALAENFAGQWLGLRTMDRRKPDPKHFPRVDDEVLEAMRDETLLFTRAIIREDRSIEEFLNASFTYWNGPLARHYGNPSINGEAFERVTLKGDQRGGIVTHGSVLSLSSYATRTSPVLRGKWVLENLLGTPPPPAPAGVPSLPEGKEAAAASLRERMQQHRAKAECAVCHDLMDPIGFGLENYDAAGAWREKDGEFAIDASGVFPGGAAFRGPAQLRDAMAAQSGLFVRNFVEKLMTFALGRGIERGDRAHVDAIVERMKNNGHRMQFLIGEIVNSQPFQQRGKNVPN